PDRAYSVAVSARGSLAAMLTVAVLITGCRASEPPDTGVCPDDSIAAPDALTVRVREPIREQLAACQLERRPWWREATVSDHVGPELAAEYRELVEQARTGPRRALVVRVLEGDRA